MSSRKPRRSWKARVGGFLHRRGIQVSRPRNDFANTIATLGVEAVIDGGANLGQFAGELRRSGFTGRIVSIEPLSAALEHLRAAQSGDPTWVSVPAALGSEPGEATFHVTPDLASSSLLARNDVQSDRFPRSVPATREIVPITTLSNVIADQGLDPQRTALKLDLQGGESAALDGAGDALGQFPVVVLEMCFVALYDAQILWPDLHDRMTRAGYEVWNFEPGWVDRSTGRQLWCDGIYVRRDLAQSIGS